MRVQSIWTAIQIRHPTGDRFLGFSRQVPLREVNRIPEFQHVAQKVRPVAETLQDAGHLRAARLGPPLIVDLCEIAARLGVFDNVDLGRFAGHEEEDEWLEYITPKIEARIRRKVEIIRLEDDPDVALLARNALPIQ